MRRNLRRQRLRKPRPVERTQDPGCSPGVKGNARRPRFLPGKGPEYNDIQSPYQLVDKLRAAGHKADLKEFNAGTGPAVEVRASSAGLYVMFVKKEFCDKLAPEKK